VYEAAARVGGGLRTTELAGTTADAVVQLLSEDYTALHSLLVALGLEDRLIRVPGRDALWRRGAAHPVRYGSFASMLGTRALPSGLKLRLGLKYLPFLERHGELTMHDPAAAAALDTESIADWGRREVGRDFVELLAYPLLASYYGVTPEETSAAYFHGLAKAGMSVEVVGANGGAGALAGAIAEALEQSGVEIRTEARVTRVEPSSDDVVVETAAGTAEHEGLVVAVPASEAARLVGDELAGAVRTRSTAMLVLATRKPIRPGWFGLSIPRTERPGDVLAAVCVQAEKKTGLGGGGGSVVLVPAPAIAGRWADSEPGVVLEEALSAAERVLPGIASNIEDSRLVRVPDGVWLPAPGHFRRLAEVEGPGELRRLAVAGAYRVAPSVEGAVRSGVTAAERVSGSGA
jgi:oxygen-dependent protoporphyrinogen oxidase